MYQSYKFRTKIYKQGENRGNGSDFAWGSEVSGDQSDV